ncbi:MAG: hypothetical protein HZB59_07455 [Ignavibacteriales bacterium]|nr:hypothetical protein [Ignavibacteriales bacterium]
MQDKYSGDVGDFGKYILLKKIHNIAGPGVRLGVNWYYCTAYEPHSTDGRHISYLSPTNKHRSKYIQCDFLLYDQLSEVINTNRRSIKTIENSRIVPSNTIFYSDPLPERNGSKHVSRANRAGWFDRSIHVLHKADIIFLDPDNGIAPASASISESRAVKYSFMHEIEAYYKKGKSVIVYNHRDRSPAEQYNRKLSDTAKFLGCAHNAKVLRFKRVSVRDYLILPQPHHENIFNSLVLVLTEEPFNFLFDKII